ncbi:MAG: formylglycine-generating enzyme family protein [Planctomycetes bacterium]|nr:formylglycine-generating enzyme family protein [Planctomycetota bacterium]
MVRIPAENRGAPRLRGFLASAGLLLAAAAAAPAQQGGAEAPVELPRLRFEFKCSFQTKAWEGKGEEEFLRRLESQRAAYAASRKDQLPALEDLVAEALWKRAEHFRARNDLESASGYAARLRDLSSKEGRVAELRVPASELVDSYSFTSAKAYEEKSDSRRAWTLYLQCVGSTNADIQAKSVEAVVRIARADSDLQKAVDAGDFAEEGAQIDTILERLDASLPAAVKSRSWPEIDGLRKRRETLSNSVGTLEISFVDVASALGGVKGGKAPLDAATAEFRLVPHDPELKPWPSASKAKAPRLRNTILAGTYDVEVYAPGSPEPAAVWRNASIPKKTTFSLRVPGLVPEGMVYVGPWQGGGGFFIDRNEVTIGEVRARAGADPILAEVLKESQSTDDRMPAWFWPDAVAAWATASGKRIPTAEQWLQAAYGPYPPAERPWPWGTAAPKAGTHFFADPTASEPRPTGSFPAGASPYGCLDMAGNLGEYVTGRDGKLWNLGGHYQIDPAKLAGGGGLQWFRDPAPGDAAFTAMDGNGQKTYKDHLVRDELTYCTGLRMVIPVQP